MTQTHSKTLNSFINARKAGTPLISYRCFDPAAAMSEIQSSINEDTPIIQWDAVNGWIGRNLKGKNAILNAGVRSEFDTVNEVEQARMALKLPENSILFMINGHMFLNNPLFVQALWNLRDEFKSDFRSIVLLGSVDTLPSEIKNDFIELDQDLPSDEQLGSMIDEITSANSVKISKKSREAAINALRGMPMFPAEQAVAMSLKKTGIDTDLLWEQKRSMIDSTAGLKIYRGEENFSQIGGCNQVKGFLSNIAKGKEAPRVVVFIDEGEKMFAGATNEVGDNTGVSQDMLATTLSFMEDNNCDGSIFVGPPGAAKSAIAKSFGNEVDIPTIMLDFGAIRGSLVGESERKLRDAYKLINAISGGRAFFILTCNKDVSLPPELKRRFTSGTFFFDLPSNEERELIWDIYAKKYDLTVTDADKAKAKGWTGAEIRNCCRMAYRQGISIADASNFIVPVSISAGADIDRLRKAATGKYLSSNGSGIYQYDQEESTKNQNRCVQLD